MTADPKLTEAARRIAGGYSRMVRSTEPDAYFESFPLVTTDQTTPRMPTGDDPERVHFCNLDALRDYGDEREEAGAKKERARADLVQAQLAMVGSELGGDPKLDWRDRSDPRWTPTLLEAWRARQRVKEMAKQVVDLMHERDQCRAEGRAEVIAWLRHCHKLVADIDHTKHSLATFVRCVASGVNDGSMQRALESGELDVAGEERTE